MLKLIQIPGIWNDGSPSIELLNPSVFEKTASAFPEETLEIIRHIKPRYDGIYVHVNGLGAGEYWGSNANGDFFIEAGLRNETAEFGYKTFEMYAYPYQHHQNKDPKASIGERVLKATWNDLMKRVELIYFISRDRASDLVARIERGEHPDVSMGTRVPFDICSICQNRAKNTSEYCTHLKEMMNHVYPDGRKVYAINTRPRFFDISHVTIGADKTAKVLAKVATVQVASNVKTKPIEIFGHAKVASMKQSSEEKSADIDKEVPAKVEGTVHKESLEPETARAFMQTGLPALTALEQDYPSCDLDRVSTYPVTDLMSTLAHMGMVLKPREFTKIVILKTSRGDDMSDLGGMKIGPEKVRGPIVMVMRKHADERSGLRPFMMKRARKYSGMSSSELATLKNKNTKALSFDSEIAEPSNSTNVLGASPFNKNVPRAAILAALYALYRMHVGKLPVETIERAIGEHPELMAMALGAGAGAITLGQHMMETQNSEAKEASLNPLKNPLTGAIGGLAVPYVVGAHYQQEHAKGKKLKGWQRFVANHPGVTGIGGAYLGAKLPGMLAKKANVKLSSVPKAITDAGIFTLAGRPFGPHALPGTAIDMAIGYGLYKAYRGLQAKQTKKEEN